MNNRRNRLETGWRFMMFYTRLYIFHTNELYPHDCDAP